MHTHACAVCVDTHLLLWAVLEVAAAEVDAGQAQEVHHLAVAVDDTREARLVPTQTRARTRMRRNNPLNYSLTNFMSALS